MILTETNLLEWKLSLNKKMKQRYDIDDYSGCKKDSEWMEDYIEASDEDAISDEIQYWD